MPNTNTELLKKIKHYYTKEGLKPMAIARILKIEMHADDTGDIYKLSPTLESLRGLVNYYIKTYNLKPKEIRYYK